MERTKFICPHCKAVIDHIVRLYPVIEYVDEYIDEDGRLHMDPEEETGAIMDMKIDENKYPTFMCPECLAIIPINKSNEYNEVKDFILSHKKDSD